jgi:LemA protein
MKKAVLIGLISIIALGFSGCSYNELTAMQQNVKGKWANVESSMQRRADLIPNLIKTAQTTAVQEQEVFGKVADARSRLLNSIKEAPAGEEGARTPEQKQAIIEANNSFGGTIGRLLSLQESYPELRSSEAFKKLMDDMSGTENRINTARLDYNAEVVKYNTARNQFPTIITASLVGFKEEPYFKADENAKTAPSMPDPNSIRKDQPATP